MILDSLRLTNIRSHKDTSVAFPKGGITLFYGDIGSGKSTILMGIEFALFGLGSFKGDSLLAKNADSGEVMLVFHVGDTKYEVGRTIKRSRTNVTQDSRGSYLRVDDVLEPLTANQLKVRILGILGLNEPTSANSKSRIYRYAVFTPQDEMKSILWDSAKRFETIRKIFHMEDYQTAIKNTETLKVEIRHLMAKYGARFENIDAKKSGLADAKKDIADIQRVIEKNTDTENDLVAQEKKANSDLSIYDERISEKNRLDVKYASTKSEFNGEEHIRAGYQKAIAENNVRLESLQGEYDTLSKIQKPTSKPLADIESEIARFDALNENVITTRSEIASTKKQIDDMAAKISRISYEGDETSLQDEIDSNHTLLESLAEDLKRMRTEHDKTNDARIRASAQVSSLKTAVMDLQKLGAKCSMCGHILTKEHMARQKDERHTLLQTAESDLENLESAHASQSDHIRDVEDKHALLSEKTQQLQALLPDVIEHKRLLSVMQQDQAKLQSLDSENVISQDPEFERAADTAQLRTPTEYLGALRDMLVEYTHSSKRTADIKDEIARLHESNKSTQQNIDTSQVRTQSLEYELGLISAGIQKYAQDGKAIAEIKEQLGGISESLRGIRDELSAGRANLRNSLSEIETLKSEIDSAEKWQKKYQKCDAYLNWLGAFFVPSVSQIEKSVMLSLQSSFNESYRRWYSQLVDDPTKDSRIDEEFAPIVEQDGFSQSVEYLSGGEKTSIALSYRLALNYTMKHRTKSLESNLLILDEPTDGLSREQLANVRELLHGLESKQIILVSHDREMISHMDHAFEVEKTSGVTAIVPKK